MVHPFCQAGAAKELRFKGARVDIAVGEVAAPKPPSIPSWMLFVGGVAVGMLFVGGVAVGMVVSKLSLDPGA